MPYLGRSSNFGVRTVFQYLPSAGDTSVSGADANGKTLSFADGNYVDVYLNGVKLKTGTDYNTTTANTIAGLTALAANDEITVVVYDAFSLATGFETLGGTFGGAVTISDTTASSSATTGALIVSGGAGIAADLSVGDDLRLISDSSVLSFGADSDVTVTHDPDDGLILKSTATGDDNPFLLTLQSGETDIAANDIIGAINFQAPDEGTGTDAILVAAGIEAVSEGDFSSSSNATSLVFKTGASEAAAEKVRILSDGKVGVGESSPSCDFVVTQSGSTFSTASQTVALFQRNSTTGHGCKVTILAGTAASSILQFGDADDEDIGVIQYEHDQNAMVFKTNATEHMRIDSIGAVTKPLQPAFSVTNTSSAQSLTAGSTSQVTFDGERFDVNGDFGSNQFTAPVTGKYYLSINIPFQNMDTGATSYLIDIFTSNRRYLQFFAMGLYGGSDNSHGFGMSILADMDANDIAKVQVAQNGGSNQTTLNNDAEFLHFTGYLVC